MRTVFSRGTLVGSGTPMRARAPVGARAPGRARAPVGSATRWRAPVGSGACRGIPVGSAACRGTLVGSAICHPAEGRIPGRQSGTGFPAVPLDSLPSRWIPCHPAELPCRPAGLPCRPAELPCRPAELPCHPAELLCHPAELLCHPAEGRISGSEKTNRTQGSISIEAVLIIPAFLLFLALILAIGRTAGVQADLHAAVVSGARTASLESTAASGEAAARQAIEDHLSREGVTCVFLDVSVDARALDLPPGQPGSVSASVTCAVPLADLAVPGLPGQIRITESFATPIDTYSQ